MESTWKFTCVRVSDGLTKRVGLEKIHTGAAKEVIVNAALIELFKIDKADRLKLYASLRTKWEKNGA